MSACYKCMSREDAESRPSEDWLFWFAEHCTEFRADTARMRRVANEILDLRGVITRQQALLDQMALDDPVLDMLKGTENEKVGS